MPPFIFIGYYATSTEDYDIKWTMPHCVLTLKLIGLAFDLCDGKKKEVIIHLFLCHWHNSEDYCLSDMYKWSFQEQLSATQKETVLREVPSFLEMAAFTYFPASFLVGPQFSMKRYLKYVKGELRNPVRFFVISYIVDFYLPSNLLILLVIGWHQRFTPVRYSRADKSSGWNRIHNSFPTWFHVRFRRFHCWPRIRQIELFQALVPTRRMGSRQFVQVHQLLVANRSGNDYIAHP